MILNQITIWQILGIFIWIGSIDCQEPLPEALGYAEPEALGYAEPEALGFAEPESVHYMLQKRSLHNHELDDELSSSHPEVEPEAEYWKRKKRETDEDSNFSEVETEKKEHYLGDGHDHDVNDFDEDENDSNEHREKRTVFTGLALYQLGKSLEKKAESNGGTQGIPYELIEDDENLGYVDGFIVQRPKRSLGSKSSQKLLNWILDKKSEKEENFRKYFVKGRYYYKPDSEFGSQDLEYLNYYSTATLKPPATQYQETIVHGCHNNAQDVHLPPIVSQQENNVEESYQVPLPDPPVVDGDDLEESYEVPPPPVVDDELEESYEVPPPPSPPATVDEELEESYEVPPPPSPPATVDEELEESYEVPPPPIPPTTVDDDLDESYEVPPPPSSYEIPLNGDNQTPILVRPLTTR